jgi:hypothetical protein
LQSGAIGNDWKTKGSYQYFTSNWLSRPIGQDYFFNKNTQVNRAVTYVWLVCDETGDDELPGIVVVGNVGGGDGGNGRYIAHTTKGNGR